MKLDPSLRWDDENVGRFGDRTGREPLRSRLAQDGITLNDFPGRFTSNAVHALGLTYSRCFTRLDLNQGRAELIGMYCKNVDNPGTTMTQAAGIKANQLTETSESVGSHLPKNLGAIA